MVGRVLAHDGGDPAESEISHDDIAGVEHWRGLTPTTR